MSNAAATAAAGQGNAAILSECRHFGACGGCTDLSPKDALLPVALAAAGLTLPPMAPMVVCPPYSRRRMDLAARRTATGTLLGLHRHRSHDIVDLHECRVLHPDLAALFQPLRDVLGRLDLLRREASVVANRLDDGIDLLLRSDAPASRHDRSRLAEFARVQGIARICHAIGSGVPESLAELRRPGIGLSGVVARPPPGGFLQATADGEAAIIAAVCAGLPTLGRRERIVELFAGIGTLTFALAAYGRVEAYEGDAAALASLDEAARQAGLAGRVTTARRDLARQPLMAGELDGTACVVLDPPAAGAALQIGQIAQSSVPRVIYVSCDTATLARDLAVLRGSGFSLLAAQAVDQFIGVHRVETICVLGRPRVRKRPRDRG